MSEYFELTLSDWGIEDISNIVERGQKIKLGQDCVKKIITNRAFLENKIQSTEIAYYGINTGFGSLCNIRIEENDLIQLQYNLIRSHACGLGSKVEAPILRLIFLLKIKNLSLGHSGVRLSFLEKMIEIYNLGVLPVIYTQGSLGASGDLAPLAHLALMLIGEGEALFEGKIWKTKELFDFLKLSAGDLKAKEGLALLNGTQFCCAYALHCVVQARKILNTSCFIGGLSLAAFEGSLSPYDPLIHKARNHIGQIKVAEAIKSLFDPEYSNKPNLYVQDPYSFRCIPQVHGASLSCIEYVENVVFHEINAVTDNPNIFHEDDKIISGGNFHAQQLAIAMDFLAIGVSEFANISERRIYQLISGLRNLPPFLSEFPGLNSGLMIAQYTAAGIVSQNKQFCTPSSVDSIVSCNGQEDHVSMGANSGVKLNSVIENTWSVLGIEMVCASQGLYFRNSIPLVSWVKSYLDEYRLTVPKINDDIVLYSVLTTSIQYLKNKKIDLI